MELGRLELCFAILYFLMKFSKDSGGTGEIT